MARAPSAASSNPESSSVAPVRPAAPGGAPVTDVVHALERDLARQGARRWVRRLAWLLAVAAVVVGVALYRRSKEPPPQARFRSQALEIRDVVEQVESTGKLKPVTEVQVGAQVSGRVAGVHVDFNSRVKKGDLLAEIDSQLFGSQVGQVTGQLQAAKASLQSATARRAATKTELTRMQQLAREGLATQIELDQAQSAADIAEAEVLAANATIDGLKAQLTSARTTLGYTKIYSPIDGVVITRAVEPGQTVAASFSAPVLFVIAEDLAQMQVLADIDEADVGKLAEGMAAKVTVDAFAGEHFEGKVTQIRYSPNEIQGVVTYSAVIDVSNPELKLRPGMTATVAITTRRAEGALAAPNAALRFKPDEKERGELTPLEHRQARVYQASDGPPDQQHLSATVVRTGITDGLWTVIESDALDEGASLVVEQLDKERERRRFMGLF